MDRLTNYTVSVIDDNNTTTFSQSFNTFPNPSIRINVDNVIGRTVRIQLNETNFLSLAEVEVNGFATSSRAAIGDNASDKAVIVSSTTDTGKILVYPNPVSTQLQVQLATRGEKVEVTLMDINGRIQSKNSFDTHDGSNLLEVDTNLMSNGIYILQILTGETKITKRIVIED